MVIGWILYFPSFLVGRILHTCCNIHVHKILINNLIKEILCSNLPNYQVMGCVGVPNSPQKLLRFLQAWSLLRIICLFFLLIIPWIRLMKHVSEFPYLFFSSLFSWKTSSKWVKHKDTKRSKNLSLRYFLDMSITVKLL